MPSKNLTYASSGVSQARGDNLVRDISPLAKRTSRSEVMSSVGGFAALSRIPKKFKNPILVTATDGVGTKILLARDMNQYHTVGIDLVAMSVNDILTIGAEPILFLDYLATSRIQRKVAKDIIRGVAVGCKQAGCALVGGETAEMPQLYRKGDFDLAGFGVGVVEEKQIVDGRKIRPGDFLVGLPSTGLHSNGFTLVREIIRRKKLSLRRKYPDLPVRLGEALLRPTKIYVSDVLPLVRKGIVRGMAHITGGGIEGNLPRILPRGLKAEVVRGSWKIPPIFSFLSDAGNVTEKEMYRTFNMGVGYILVVSQAQAKNVLRRLKGSQIVGEIKRTNSKPRVEWH